MRDQESFVDNLILNLVDTIEFYGQEGMDAMTIDRGRDLIMRMALNLLYSKAFAVNVTKYRQYADMYCIMFANMLKWRARLVSNLNMIDSVLMACALLYEAHPSIESTLKKYILPVHI